MNCFAISSQLERLSYDTCVTRQVMNTTNEHGTPIFNATLNQMLSAVVTGRQFEGNSGGIELQYLNS